MIRLTMIFLLLILVSCTSNKVKNPIEVNATGSYFSGSLITEPQANSISSKYFNIVLLTSEDTLDGKDWINPTFLEEFKKYPAQQVLMRNDMIDDLIILSDWYFQNYKISTFTQRKVTDMTFDTYSTLLSGTAAVTTGGVTPNILSGIASFISGSKNNFNKAFFSEQTAESIISIMETNRLVIPPKNNS